MKHSPNDALDGEVSVSGEITESGVKASAKSRAVSALDRLIGNVIDLANPALEGLAARKRAKNASDAEIARALTERLVEQVKQSELPFAKEAIENHYRQVLSKERNKRAVLDEAINELKKLPNEQLDTTDGRPDLGDDWLHQFSSYAEKASSEAIRSTWAKVLSGEISRPGSFSFTTLRIISEIDLPQAQYFQELASHAFGSGGSARAQMVLLKPPNLGDETLDRLLQLEAIGLIQEVGGFFRLNIDGVRGAQPFARLDHLVVVVSPVMGSQQQLTVDLIKLTRAGQQLATIIPKDHLGAAKLIGEEIKRKGWGAKLHLVTAETDDSLSYRRDGVDL